MQQHNHYEVIVVGVGAMGAAACYQLSQSGLKVLGIDQYIPPHSMGSSHGESRIIRQAYFEDSRYVPILQRSYSLWKTIEAETGSELLNITGCLSIGKSTDAIMEGSRESAIQFQLPFRTFDAEDLKAKFPQFSVENTTMGFMDETAGYIHPEKAIAAQIKLAEMHGCKFIFNEKVGQWKVISDGKIQITTVTKTFQADKLVICGGAWAKSLLRELKIPLRVERHIQCFIKPSTHPELFMLGNFPVFLMTLDDDHALYGFPSENPEEFGVKVAIHPIGSQNIYHSEDPDQLIRNVTEKEITKMKMVLASRIPMLAGDCIRSLVCMYTNTTDKNPVIDRHPNYDQIFIAAGFSGHGFKFSNVVGEILRDLVLDNNSQMHLEIFKAERFI